MILSQGFGMRPQTRPPISTTHARVVVSAVTAVVAIVMAAAWLTTATTDAQTRGEHWVGTWATAVVARPQTAQGGQPPAAPPQLPLTASGQEHTSELQSHVNIVCRLLL